MTAAAETAPRGIEREVWFVDDDEADREIFAFTFRQQGIALRVFSSAEDAVARLKSGSAPALILSDIRMPGLGGFHLLEYRREAKLSAIPVIMISTSANPVDIGRAYASGANAYLEKPPDYASLKELVAHLKTFWFDTVVLPRPKK